MARPTGRHPPPAPRSPCRQETQVFRDDGSGGASLKRPGPDRLRDRAARAAFDPIALTAPDRLARQDVHQLPLIEELEGAGGRVEFAERPMREDPHDRLLPQIRGAVAEYEPGARLYI